MGGYIISDAQNRIKDCFASSQLIDLTVRSNGEEKTKVIDAQGSVVVAGLEAPTVAPTLTIGTATGLTPSKYVAYRYVYAATARYPLVQNAVTGGGSLAPRSNPSPLQSILTDAAVGGKKINVTITKSLRPDINRIWIYRTDYYDTLVEAQDAATAGELYYLDLIANPQDGVAGTVVYVDSTVDVTSGELIELDNFVAPTFQFVLYAEPYFWGFGNFAMVANVTVDATGLVTLTIAKDKWYDGRNGQVVTMEGINEGGYDSFGGYYFKWLSATTGQLYLDPELTIPGTVNASGYTVITIKGLSSTLFRSKPNNPFSWGETNIVGDLTIPELVSIRVGGGEGTAMAIVPTSSTLKLDTEKPNKSYTFNLRQAGTDAFIDSKREISNTATASNHWAQTESQGDDSNILFFYDNNTATIAITDGSSIQDISSPVFETLRNVRLGTNAALHAHMIYDSKHQLLITWVPQVINLDVSGGDPTGPDYWYRALIFHFPTKTWSTLMSPDITCSATIIDTETNERKTIIGNAIGRIGQMLTPGQYYDWLTDGANPDLVYQRWPVKGDWSEDDASFIERAIINEASDIIMLVGMWVYLVQDYQILIYARIESITLVSGNIYQINFDQFYDIRFNNFKTTAQNSEGSNFDTYIFAGVTFCSIDSSIWRQNPITTKKLTEVWVQAANVYSYIQTTVDNVTRNLFFKFYRRFAPPYLPTTLPIELVDLNTSNFKDITPDKTWSFLVLGSGNTAEDSSEIFYIKNPISIDMLRTIIVSLQSLGYSPLMIHNFSLVFDGSDTPNN